MACECFMVGFTMKTLEGGLLTKRNSGYLKIFVGELWRINGIKKIDTRLPDVDLTTRAQHDFGATVMFGLDVLSDGKQFNKPFQIR